MKLNWQNFRAPSPASRARIFIFVVYLGLAPQALCCRPLRGLGADLILLALSLEFKAYA